MRCPGFWFVLVLIAVPAARADKICDPEQPTHCSQYVVAGTKAPFDGQLLTTDLAIDLGLKADSCERVVGIEVKHEKKLASLDIALERSIRKSVERMHAEELEIEKADRDRWREAAAVPFYEKPWFVALMTAGVIGSIVVGTAQLTR